MPDPSKPPGEQGPALDEMLCFSIYSTGHAFNQFYRPLLDRIGLTYPQYLAMVALWARDDRTVKELGEALHLESNTLTPLLKRLEGLGHIQRSRDPEDERQVRVRLTEQGRALRAEAKHIAACVREVLDMSLDDLDRIQREIESIRGRLLNRRP
ncbi:MarR family transcriptional regulator [Roseomonas eburnea]|uniref:MarR family transcriptional regulator n=1 Tax=Neoroseomonas eburnea TaxID=1346889 RepID=A0A9X9XCT5_9PROT|nr:MarR family transcriptional regulator [Neoroseomonas eburnea]MBR0681521.1 MarR family transcriptional regulator [Neoroseomonas eburnea]